MSATTAEITVEEILANRARWAEALRSGDYEQARGVLKDDEGRYCCLGVADLIFNGEVVECGFIPTDGTIRALGLYGQCGTTAVLDEHGNDHHLAGLNDEYLSFAEIADLIDDGQVLLNTPGGDA